MFALEESSKLQTAVWQQGKQASKQAAGRQSPDTLSLQ